MTTFFRTILCMAIAVVFPISCNNSTGKGPEPEPEPETFVFAKGADIGWATEMESDGITFRNASGNAMECTALMKELGFDAIRIRVWVDPDPVYSSWCGKEDVMEKARRAAALGMRIMIDFHYSDRWADPSNQFKPRAWAGYNANELCNAISAHTVDILSALKAEGIAPEWVQVGNETSNGMLWPDGQADKNMQTYARMTNAGYDAVKSVFPDAKVIVHLDHGDNPDLYNWIFDGLKANGGKWDIIGMSLYPEYYDADGTYNDGDYTAVLSRTVSNILSLYMKYGTKSMICEAGMSWNNPEESYRFLSELLKKTSTLQDNCCLGVFYWEPQCNPAWRPSTYETLGWNAYDKGAFEADFKPTKALDAFKN